MLVNGPSVLASSSHGCAAPSLSVVIAREMARHRLRRIPFIGVPRAAIRDRPPQRAQQGVQHLPHMAQLADFMRYQVHAAIPAVAVHA